MVRPKGTGLNSPFFCGRHGNVAVLLSPAVTTQPKRAVMTAVLERGLDSHWFCKENNRLLYSANLLGRHCYISLDVSVRMLSVAPPLSSSCPVVGCGNTDVRESDLVPDQMLRRKILSQKRQANRT